ncbi:alpha/beta fold hydrolase [Rheinheimera sp.]|uniref:alpha/beta fold hydrolase n=1 Tax=Rheinheimera sp. TaxID=1869214 RepID=UPI003D2C74EE
MVQPVVLLRGLAREQAHWGDFPARLAQQSARPVWCQDLPGMGQFHQEQSPADMTRLAELMLPRLRRQHPGPWHLVAMSLGAMLAVQLAALAPQQVASLVLINTSAGTLTPFYQRLRWQQYPKVLSAFFAPVSQRERLILQLTSHRWQPQQLLQAVDIARHRPVQRLNVLRQLMAASRFSLPAKPQCPMLLLSGGADQLVDPICSQRLAEYWQVQHRQHPHAGHDVVLDAPDWLLGQLLQFYASAD